MDLLDENINLSGKTSIDTIDAIRKTRKDYEEMHGKVKAARITSGIIAGLTVFPAMMMGGQLSDPLLLGTLVVTIGSYIAGAATGIEYSRYALSLASFIYGINILFALASGNAIVLVIGGVILYFLIRGTIAAWKAPEILNKMKALDIPKPQYL